MCACMCVCMCLYMCMCVCAYQCQVFPSALARVHMIDVGLSDPCFSNENLGYIRLFIKIDCNDSKLSTKMVSFHFHFSIAAFHVSFH